MAIEIKPPVKQVSGDNGDVGLAPSEPGGTFTIEDSSGQRQLIISDGVTTISDTVAVDSSEESVIFSKSNADPEESDWRLRANTDGSFKIEALDSGGNVKLNGTIKIDKTGKVSAPNFSQNNYPVISSNDPMYVLISALLNGNMSEDMTLRSDSGTALTLKVVDNAGGAGIAWQNTGDSYTLAIEREVVGSFGADMVFRAGRDDDTSLIAEAMRIRGTEDGNSATKGDVIVRQALHADSVVSTEEATARGQTLMHNKNFGVESSFHMYKSTHPTLPNSTIADWFTRGSRVYFVGTGAGVINMPEIVTSNPTIDQVLVGTEVQFANLNSGSAITLDRFDSSSVFMAGNVGNTSSSTSIISSSQVRITALDLTNYPSIGKLCWVVVSA